MVLFTQRRGRWEVSFPLVPQVGRNTFYSLQDLLVVQSDGGRGDRFLVQHLLFDGRVIFAQRAGRLDGLAQDVTAPVAGHGFGGKTEAKLVSGAMRAEQLQFGVPQFRIHLHNGDPILLVFCETHLHDS